MDNKKFDAFIKRLKRAKTGPIPRELKNCILSAKLQAIFDKVIADNHLAKKVQALTPGKAIRLTKNEDQARTLCLIKTLDGEYACILETKSKNKFERKQSVPKSKGTYKTCKPAWRLDGKNGPELYASLVVNVSQKAHSKQKYHLRSKVVSKARELLEKEVGFAWSLPECPQLQRPMMGALYVNDKGVQQSIYAAMGTPLDTITPDINLSKEDLDQIALDIFTGLALMHEHGYPHQDLKDANIVFFKNKDALARAQLMDYGFVAGPNYLQTATGPYEYESPEIAIAFGKAPRDDKTKTTYRYFSQRYQKYGSTIGKETALSLEKQYSQKGLAELRELYKNPDPANDIWSCGVVLWDLYHPQPLKTLPKDKFFSRMLDPNRKTRATAKEMVALLRQRMGLSAQPSIAPSQTVAAKPVVQAEAPKVYQPRYQALITSTRKIAKKKHASKLQRKRPRY